MESFAVIIGQSSYFFFGLLGDVDLGASVEFGSASLRPFALIGIGIVEIGIFLTVLMHSLGVLFSSQWNNTAHFTIMLQVPIR